MEGRRGDLEFGTIPHMLALSAARHADRAALVDEDVVVGYRELPFEVARAARGLIALGIQPGDRVAIWAQNCWEWVVAALAVHSAGAVLVPINTRFKGAEAGWVLARSGARVLFTVNGFLGADYVGMLAMDGGEQPALESIVVLRGPAPPETLDWNTFLEFAQVVAERDVDARVRALVGDDLSDILFTSGTTGRPKGVLGTHEQTLRVFRDWADIVGLAAGDRYLVVAPFFHSFGYKAGWLAALMKGATVYPQSVFDPTLVLEKIERERITVMPGPPTLYQTLLAHPERHGRDLSSLRLAVTGAAVIPVELVTRMRHELGFRTVITGYGLTETTGVVTMCRPGDDPETIATTSGRAVPGVEVRVVDEAGRDVGVGAPGEVWARGYNVMRGYHDEPAESAVAIDGGGWLHTGDIGVLDAGGNLRITDRKKDMFIVGGFNAYPAEIEQVLRGHEQIQDVAVVGVPDERLGEVGVAFVVAKPGDAPLGADELVEWSRSRMANFKVPRRFEIVPALPLNASGKVLKHELRARAQAAPHA